MTVFETIRESCRRYAAKPAIAMLLQDGGSKTFTYAQLLDRSMAWARVLNQAGIRAGDRVALIAENSPEWVMAFLAIVSLRGTAVLIDSSLQDTDLGEFVRRSDVRGLMLSPVVRARFSSAKIFSIPTFDIFEEPGTSLEKPSNLDTFIPEDPAFEEDIAAILYSSGTTSSSKGVMHSHGGIRTMADKIIAENRLTEQDRFLAILPLYHIFGFMAKMISPLFCGASVFFLESVNSESLGKAFQTCKPTVFCAVPRVFDMFRVKITETMKSKGTIAFALLDLLMKGNGKVRSGLGLNPGPFLFQAIHAVFGSQIRILVSGGTAIREETVRFFHALGFDLFNNYGITETNLPIAANIPGHFTMETAGKPYPGVEIRITEPDDSGMGEIQVRSPGMMMGYFRDPESTKAAFSRTNSPVSTGADRPESLTQGWFRTGDLGFLDASGNLVVRGRLKENILLANGKKVAPTDVEKKYEGIPGVADLAVCGIPIPSGASDEIHAFIVRDMESTAGEKQIEGAVRDLGAGLSQQMRISRIHFVREIPRTALQKPKRYLLKSMVLSSPMSPWQSSKEGAIPPEFHRGFEQIEGILSRFDFVKGPISIHSRLFEDLGFDSLSVTEFCAFLEKETGTNVSELIRPNLSVGEIVKAFDGRKDAAGSERKWGNVTISHYPLRRGRFEKWILESVGRLTKTIVHFDLRGLENLPNRGGYLLCPNHETYLDSLYVLIHLPEKHRRRCCNLAKIELAGTLPGRFVLRVAGAIPVDRTGDPGSSLQRCLEKLREDWILLIHPEGTRSPDGTLGELKKGAAKLSIDSGKPIVPVRLKGGYAVLPSKQVIPNLFDLKALRRHTIGISFGKPLFPERHTMETLTEVLKKSILGL